MLTTTSSDLGAERPADPLVYFCENEVVDSRSLAAEITQALSSVGFSSPPHWLKRYGHLSNGQQFDTEYMQAMVKDHKSAVESFEKASKEAKDADVKAFATKTLPTLKHHLSMAEALQQKVGK